MELPLGYHWIQRHCTFCCIMLISHIYSDTKSIKTSFPAKDRRSFMARLINLSKPILPREPYVIQMPCASLRLCLFSKPICNFFFNWVFITRHTHYHLKSAVHPGKLESKGKLHEVGDKYKFDLFNQFSTESTEVGSFKWFELSRKPSYLCSR